MPSSAVQKLNKRQLSSQTSFQGSNDATTTDITGNKNKPSRINNNNNNPQQRIATTNMPRNSTFKQIRVMMLMAAVPLIVLVREMQLADYNYFQDALVGAPQEPLSAHQQEQQQQSTVERKARQLQPEEPRPKEEEPKREPLSSPPPSAEATQTDPIYQDFIDNLSSKWNASLHLFDSWDDGKPFNYTDFWQNISRKLYQQLEENPPRPPKDPAACPKVYMYNLSADLQDGPPNVDNLTLAFGPPDDSIDSSASATWQLRRTSHYQMPRIMQYRLLNSKHCLTDNPDEADLFYLPFFPNGRSKEEWKQTCKDSRRIMNSALKTATPILNKDTACRHFVTMGRESYVGKPCKGWWDHPVPLLKDAVRISHSSVRYAFSHTDPNNYHPKDTPTMPNMHSMPFPTSLHFTRGGTLPWQPPSETDATTTRPYRMLFVGRTETGDRLVREQIGRQCRLYNNASVCNMRIAVAGGVTTSIATKMNATFCLEPSGDNPNRKSISDSIVSGCIPIFFSGRAGQAWHWHWDHWKWSGHIAVPRIPFIQGKIDLQKLLVETIPPDIIPAMQQSIYRNARQWQYSLDDDPDDGFRVLLEGLVDRADKDPKCKPRPPKPTQKTAADAIAGASKSTSLGVKDISSMTKRNKSSPLDTTFRILCTAKRSKVYLPNGSYKVRCGDFKLWAAKCTANVEVTTEPIDAMVRKYKLADKRNLPLTPFNATVMEKYVFPEEKFMGSRIVVDVVDKYLLVDKFIPKHFDIIVQNAAHGKLFEHKHKIHIVEHPYTYCKGCAIKTDVRAQNEISDKRPLHALSIMTEMPANFLKGIPELNNVNLLYIDENRIKIKEAFGEAFAKGVNPNYTQADGDAVYDEIHATGGIGLAYNTLFRYFDVLIVFMKGGKLKGRYGSVQRITNQMYSGVPVMVEADGIFKDFVEEHNYPCAFYSEAALMQETNETKKRLSYEELMQNLRDDIEWRTTCQRRGLEIAELFSPSMIGQAMLRSLGYDTAQEGAILC